jgi:hypothetical protein
VDKRISRHILWEETMTRSSLLALLGFVALTSIAGGAVMVASASLGTERLGLPRYLSYSP